PSNTIYASPAQPIHWDFVWNPSAWWWVGGIPMAWTTGLTDVTGFGTSTWTAHPAVVITLPEKGWYQLAAFASPWQVTSSGSVSMRIRAVSAGSNVFTTQSDMSLSANFIGQLTCGPYNLGVLDKSSQVRVEFFSADSTMKVRWCSLLVKPIY